MALSKDQEKRTKADCLLLHAFLMRYKFFIEMQRRDGFKSVLAVLKHIKAQRIPKDAVLFDQGEEGERFYVILQGTVGVEIAYETPVAEYTKKMKLTNADKVKNYL